MKDFRSQFRLPVELADKLKNSAEENRRSLNAEIVNRLERSYEEGAEQLDRIESGVNQLLSRQ
jgi:hypothetical protein